MNATVSGRLIVVVTAVLVLSACASAEVRARREAAAAARTGAPVSADALAAGYRRVVKGDQEYFCRKEGVTGSRTQSVETCLTQAQLKAQAANSQDMLRKAQENPGEQPVPMGSAPMDPARFPN